MANSSQARKRARQAEQRRRHNASLRAKMRTHVKNTIKAAATGDKEAAERSFKMAAPIVDRMANKGLIAKNKAARYKSRLNARIKGLASP